MSENNWKGFLTHSGFIVPVSTVKSRFGPKYNDLLSKLTITHHQKVGPPKYARMYKFAEFNGISCIFLPRTLIKTLTVGKILDVVEVLFAPINPICAELKLDLYANQHLLIEYLCNTVYTPKRITNGSASAILNLRAGMGKTYVAGGLVSRLGVRTLYVVPKRPLAVQTVKDLRACFYPDDGSKPDVLVGMYGKKAKKSDPSTNVANQNVTVIVINSAIDRDVAFFSGYSCVILDEVHMYCSDQRREIFRKASTHIMLGMSATTEDRNDGFDPIAHKELAFDGIIRAENVPGFTYEDVAFQGLAKIIYYNGPPEFTRNLTHESTGRVFTHYMHNQFIGDPYRLQSAVDELIALYDWRGSNNQQHYIYVFAEEIEILTKAKAAFIEALKNRLRDDIADDIGFEEGLEMFTGGLKDAKITDITQNARVLFSTFSYASTGISILKMTAILFITPRKANMKQTIARVLRRGSDISIPRIVVDFVDNKTALRYQVGARKQAYEFYQFKIEEVKVKYDNVPIRCRKEMIGE